MMKDDAVSLWLEELKQGDDSAARKLWDHFVLRLYEAARKKLRPDSRRVYDEQDAAQSAFYALCAGVSAGRFPDLTDRTSLWRLLLVITARKIANRHRYDCQEQRDVRRINTHSRFQTADGSEFLQKLPAREPSPEFELEFLEMCGSLFEGLDPQLQHIGRLKIEGFSDQEIADQVGCTRRTVRRKVERIRRNWEDSPKDQDDPSILSRCGIQR